MDGRCHRPDDTRGDDPRDARAHRPSAAGTGTQAIYACVFVAAVLRIVAACIGSDMLLDYAGAAWIAGFAGFVLLYGPMLAMRKESNKPA